MPRYAHFDPAAPAPAPVLGWYDTDLLDYGDKLPSPAALLLLTDPQWAGRLTATQGVQGGTLVPAPPRAIGV